MYLLRWRFDYLERPTKLGQWSRGASKGPDGEVILSDMAAYQKTDGLVRVSIEGKDQVSRDIKVLAQCDGWDYVNFQWMMMFRGRTDGKGSYHCVGLKLMTTDYELQVFAINGMTMKRARTEEDKKFHYATFGR